MVTEKDLQEFGKWQLAYLEKKGVFAYLEHERVFAKVLAFRQLEKVDKWLQNSPALELPQRCKIITTYNELKMHTQEIDEALHKYALLSGAFEYHNHPLPGVDYTMVKDVPRHQLLQEALKAEKRASKAEKRNDDLINELATLCPGIGSPYQSKKKPDRNQ